MGSTSVPAICFMYVNKLVPQRGVASLILLKTLCCNGWFIAWNFTGNCESTHHTVSIKFEPLTEAYFPAKSPSGVRRLISSIAICINLCVRRNHFVGPLRPPAHGFYGKGGLARTRHTLCVKSCRVIADHPGLKLNLRNSLKLGECTAKLRQSRQYLKTKCI